MNNYWIGAFIVGLLGAVVIWIYSMTQWGLLIGLLIGWLPAAIGGVVIGIIWPLVLIVVGYFILMIVRGS